MKRIILLVLTGLLFASSASAESQIGGKAGQWYLGFNLNSGEQLEYSPYYAYCPFGISFGKSSETTNPLFTYSGLLEAGYFISDGLQIGLSYFQQISWDFENIPFVFAGLGPEIGYLFDLGGAFSPYVQLDVEFLFTVVAESMFVGFKAMPIAGGKYFISKTIALDLGVFFNYSMEFEQFASTPVTLTNMYVGFRFGVNLFS